KNKRGQNTKRKIVSAAWRLFYEQGYDHTTVDEIIELLAQLGQRVRPIQKPAGTLAGFCATGGSHEEQTRPKYQT
ncbi:TetR/AcrR family transcriptional regulator, partial [Candidatus Avoscillospira sp. LCP25S3_F1]|uniref:TetR/AcrR family transcriptional regulator n=1 Tax=Candidatus Avoscillospira sp. LCP25S3_F1 TaxID=3438825 RepID=UPI003F8F7E5F